MLHQGGCLCGQLRYETIAPPKQVTICFCRFCQRSTGSLGMVEPIFTRAAHRQTKGAPSRYSLASSGSGKTVTINFCPNCGTKLFLEFERFPDSIGVFAGTFDDPNWFEQTPENTRYIYLEAAAKGTFVRGGFSTYHEHALLLDGTLREPIVHAGHVLLRD